jgi:hypothetical protein
MNREQRRRDQRMANAAGRHWLAASKDIQNRFYAAVLETDRQPGVQYPVSSTRPCIKCHQNCIIDNRLIPLADRSKGVVCTSCIESAQGKKWENIMLNELNRDNGAEI